MKRNNLLIYLLLVMTLLIIALPLAGCAGSGKSMAEMTNAAAIAGTTTANSNQVICKNNKFVPDTLTVKVGTTVTWVNQDSYIHTVTSGTSPSDRSGLFDSGNVNGGKTFSFTFDKAGTYDYFCIPHFSLGMIGKIIVTE
jgi:manganese oxidase